MKKLIQTLSLLLALALASPVFAQTILTTTTLASAVTSTSTTSIQLTSNAGLTGQQAAIFVADTGNSGEAMFVNAVSSAGGYISVTRGYQTLGKARTHASGALVFLLPNLNGFGIPMNTIAPSGSCTRSTEPYLPLISVGEYGERTQISDCVGGVWVQGSGINYAGPFLAIRLPEPGGTAYSALNTNGTAPAAATDMYCTELDVPYSKFVTGLGVLNGTTVGTDKHLMILYDGSGNLVANSATAGALSATASVYQQYAFVNSAQTVTKYYVVGPAKYYGCMQTNGTTATVRMTITGTNDTQTTSQTAGQTFGTIAATFTVPTTFTTAVGPYMELY
jgi:hypothetical protein